MDKIADFLAALCAEAEQRACEAMVRAGYLLDLSRGQGWRYMPEFPKLHVVLLLGVSFMVAGHEPPVSPSERHDAHS